MIKNERQYLITKAQAGKFKEAIEAFNAETPDTHPLLVKAQRDAMESQKDLARKLGLKEQQIQRYEETDYASASLHRVYEVIKALDIEVREEVILDYGQGFKRN